MHLQGCTWIWCSEIVLIPLFTWISTTLTDTIVLNSRGGVLIHVKNVRESVQKVLSPS